MQAVIALAVIRRWAPLLVAAALVSLLAVPASASAGFADDFAVSVAHPEGNSGKDWVEPYFVKLSLATKETGEPDHAGYPGGHSAWISWHFHEDTDVQARACGAKEADLVIAVYTGTAVNELTEVASQGEETEAGCAVVRFDAEEGVTYRIAVDAKSSPGTTAMDFWMESFAPNDDFADATVVSTIPSTMEVDPQLATTEPGEPDHPGNGDGNSVWYRWTPWKSGFARIYNCVYWSGSSIAVYTGSSLGRLDLVASGKGGGPCSEPIEPRFHVKAGTTYSIAVEGHAEKTWKLVTAFGWVPRRFLAVTRSGSGGGTVASDPVGIDCGGTCQAGYYWGPNVNDRPSVTLSAIPDPGSTFVGWSGEGCSGASPTCDLSLKETATTVDAEFQALPSLLATPPVPTPSAPLKPKRKKPQCAKHKKSGKKVAKASKRRRACKR
ncbi:MAG TPA: hypothetical protein VFS54_01350 [Solirubrobacterales bacterium]|nr:hypothetical protein [Solirubrobacterales bacterium]